MSFQGPCKLTLHFHRTSTTHCSSAHCPKMLMRSGNSITTTVSTMQMKVFQMNGILRPLCSGY